MEKKKIAEDLIVPIICKSCGSLSGIIIPKDTELFEDGSNLGEYVPGDSECPICKSSGEIVEVFEIKMNNAYPARSDPRELEDLMTKSQIEDQYEIHSMMFDSLLVSPKDSDEDDYYSYLRFAKTTRTNDSGETLYQKANDFLG